MPYGFVEVDQDSLKDVYDRLDALADKLKKNVVGKAMREALQLPLQAAKDLCPVGKDAYETKERQIVLGKGGVVKMSRPRKVTHGRAPGTLKRSLHIIRGRSRAGVQRYRIVTGGKLRKNDGYYGVWVEFGHFAGKRSGRVRRGLGMEHRSFVAAHPFMRPAFDSTEQGMVAILMDEIKTGAEASAAK